MAILLAGKQLLALIITSFMISALITFGSSEITFAGGNQKPVSNFRSRHHFHQPNTPPGFPHKWFNKDVIEILKKHKLALETVSSDKELNHGSRKSKAKEITRFFIPSLGEEVGGYIFSFEKQDDLEQSRKHYLEQNKEGNLYTWSFVKDNILIVLTGILPESEARLYENAIYSLKK
jgi:hypothetical protein